MGHYKVFYLKAFFLRHGEKNEFLVVSPNGYLSKMLFKLNGFHVVQIPLSRFLQFFLPYYTCWVAYFIFLQIKKHKNAWVFCFSLTIDKGSTQLHLQLQSQKHSKISNTPLNKLTILPKIGKLMGRFIGLGGTDFVQISYGE